MSARVINPSGPIGLDIGSRWIKAVQLGRGPGGIRVPARWAAWPRLAPGTPMDASEASRAVDVLEARGFSGLRVVIGAAETLGATADLELPGGVSAQARHGVAVLEACRVMKLAPGSFELALWELPKPARAGDGVQASAFALTHDTAEALMNPLESTGMRVVGIDVASAAVARQFAGPGVETLDLSIDVGVAGARFSVASGGRIVYHRRLDELGLAGLIEACEERVRGCPRAAETAVDMLRLEAPGAKDVVAGLVAEAAVSVEYAWHRYPDREPGRVFVTGGGAWLVDAEAVAAEVGLAGAGAFPVCVPSGPEVAGGAGLPWMFSCAACLAAGSAA